MGQNSRQPCQKRLAVENIRGAKSIFIQQACYGIKITTGVCKHRIPRMIETVPIVGLCDKPTKTENCRFFIIAADRKVSIEHGYKPLRKIKQRHPALPTIHNLYSIRTSTIYLPLLAVCILRFVLNIDHNNNVYSYIN